MTCSNMQFFGFIHLDGKHNEKMHIYPDVKWQGEKTDKVQKMCGQTRCKCFVRSTSGSAGQSLFCSKADRFCEQNQT